MCKVDDKGNMNEKYNMHMLMWFIYVKAHIRNLITVLYMIDIRMPLIYLKLLSECNCKKDLDKLEDTNKRELP